MGERASVAITTQPLRSGNELGSDSDGMGLQDPVLTTQPLQSQLNEVYPAMDNPALALNGDPAQLENQKHLDRTRCEEWWQIFLDCCECFIDCSCCVCDDGCCDCGGDGGGCGDCGDCDCGDCDCGDCGDCGGDCGDCDCNCGD